MSLALVQHRALLALDSTRHGGRPEDDLVELKSELPDAVRAARRIAAMANAARGEQFLWLVGVDEKGNRFPAEADLAYWWGAVHARFQGDPPVMQSTHVEDVLVLAFDPESAPYVVKTGHQSGVPGIPTHEVPWREGTRTRTAQRQDLLRILVPTLRAPEIEVLSGEVRISAANSPTGWQLSASLRLYITPRSRELVTLPAHRAKLTIASEDGRPVHEGDFLTGFFSHIDGSMAEAVSSAQVYCAGPGSTQLSVGGIAKQNEAGLADRLLIAGSLGPAPEGPAAKLRTTFERVRGAGSDTMIWRL
jgi:hypothetical protein